MRVLLTGGTGFTGRRVARRLVERGHRLRCLVLPADGREVLSEVQAEIVTGDLGEPASVVDALRGMDALLNVASIGFGHGPGVVRCCEEAGVRRAVFFSTTAIFTRLPAQSKAVRLKAEEAIRRSTLDWTILRPTMIYGAPGDRNVERLLRTLSRRPVLPIVGRGESLIQPVLVDDIAVAAVSALEEARAVRSVYELPGREAVSFRDFVSFAATAVGRRALLVPVPALLALAAVRMVEAVSSRPRIRTEQVMRLLEDKDFDWSRARRDLGYDPVGVEDGLSLEAGRLGLGVAGADFSSGRAAR